MPPGHSGTPSREHPGSPLVHAFHIFQTLRYTYMGGEYLKMSYSRGDREVLNS